MRTTLLFLAFVIATTMSRHALADDTLRRDVTCVVDQITPQESRLILDALYYGPGPERDRLTERMGAAQRVCMRRYSWDMPRLERVSMMVVAALATREMGTDLRADGVDVAAIDRWFERQDNRFKVGAFIDMDEDDAWDILETLDLPENPLMPLKWNTIRNYVQSKAVTERQVQGLPDPPRR